MTADRRASGFDARMARIPATDWARRLQALSLPRALTRAAAQLRDLSEALFTYLAASIGVLLSARRANAQAGGWRVADSTRDPDLIADVATLASRARMPAPRVHVMASERACAFVLYRGPGRATIAISDSLLCLLTREERFGVLAHEIAHLCERRTPLQIAGALFTRALMVLVRRHSRARASRGVARASRGVARASRGVDVLAIIVGMLQTTTSRRREYAADRLGATLCGNPLWLAAALQRLQDAGADAAVAYPALLRSIFSTHPEATKRIAALQRLAGIDPVAERQGVSARPARRWRPFGVDATVPTDASFRAPSFVGGRGLHASGPSATGVR